MGDKYRRAQNLVRSAANEQVGEGLRDTLIDLAAYALIAVTFLDEGQLAKGALQPEKDGP